jgi:predicted ribosome quality control (RQC) complex YloA/Tae2 family protein
MALSVSEITEVLKEIAPAVVGGSVQRLYQPTPQTIDLEIRRPGRTLRLLLSADPESARLHLTRSRSSPPSSPPPFCQLLRAHVAGGRIVGVEQWEGDRIVRLRIKTRDASPAIVAELTGRSANILLLDSQEKILGTLRSGPSAAGQLYMPPLAGRWITFEDRFPAAPVEQSHPVSAAIEQRSEQQEAERAAIRLKRNRLAELRKAMKKTLRRLEGLNSDLNKAARYRDYARYGELLKTHLSQVTKGQDRITVIDYFDPALPEMVLPLNPAKNAKGNMEEYFSKHRKHLAAETQIRPRIEAATRELAALRTELHAIERGETIPAAAQTDAGRLPRHHTAQSRSQKAKGPFRRFTSADGLQIFVGRNAEENEELTFALARPHDLWFHAQGAPGSHVVLRLEKGIDPPAESIRDAATLALLYSGLKRSGKGEVIYTLRRHVRKAKGKSSGTVSVTQEKSIYVELDRSRLQRLRES